LFEHDFLDADGADVYGIARVGDFSAGGVGEEMRVVKPPQKDMRIEKELHSSGP
jgi:hypothetical protein